MKLLKMIIQLIMYVLFIILLGGCILQEENEIEIELKEPLLVIDGLINPNLDFGVFISQTRGFEEIRGEDPFAIEQDARVIISKGDEIISTLKRWEAREEVLTPPFYQQNERFYKSYYYSEEPFDPIVGREYMLEVIAEGFPRATAKTTKMANVEILEADFKIVEKFALSFAEINLKFQDPPNESNYYFITVDLEEVFSHKTFRMKVDRLYENIDQGEMLLQNLTFNGDVPKSIMVLDDHGFNGKETNYTFLMPNPGFKELDSLDVEGGQLTKDFAVYLRHVSKETYDYVRRINDLQKAEEDIISDVFPVKSNVENGAGLFVLPGLSKVTFTQEQIKRD